MRLFTIILLSVALTQCGSSTTDPIITWRSSVETEVHSLSAALDDFGQHMGRYYDDSSSRKAVEADIDAIQQVHQRLLLLSVPADRAEVHAQIK